MHRFSQEWYQKFEQEKAKWYRLRNEELKYKEHKKVLKKICEKLDTI